MTIEALEAQLLLEKTGGADLAQLCKSKDAAIELERRNYSSVQELNNIIIIIIIITRAKTLPSSSSAATISQSKNSIYLLYYLFYKYKSRNTGAKSTKVQTLTERVLLGAGGAGKHA